MMLIPESVHEFMRVRQYYKEFPGAAMPSYRDVSVRFMLATNYFSAKVNDYTRYLKAGK